MSTTLKIYDQLNRIPAHNFHYAAGDLRYLVKLSQGKEIEDVTIKKKHVKGLVKAYSDLENQFIKQFGFDEAYLRNFESHVELAALRVEYMSSGDGKMMVLIKRKESEIESNNDTDNKYTFEDLVASVSKQIGFHIDPKTMDALMFNSYVVRYKLEMKAIQEQLLKKSA